MTGDVGCFEVKVELEDPALCCFSLASEGVWFWGFHSWGLVGGGLELSLKLREEFCSNGSVQLVDDVLGNLSGHGDVGGVHIG